GGRGPRRPPGPSSSRRPRPPGLRSRYLQYRSKLANIRARTRTAHIPPQTSAAEYPITGPGAGLPVIERAELRRERCVRPAVTVLYLRDVLDRRDHLIGGTQQRAGCSGRKVEVEAAQVVAVLLKVIGEEQHRLASRREIEHHRRVVGHQEIPDEEELGD